MASGRFGYPPDVTDESSDRDAAARLDPERAVDELEERTLGRRTDAADDADDAADPDDVDPEGDDGGTGIVAEPAD